MRINIHAEEWRTIPNFPKYEASNTGKVRNKATLHELSPNRNSKGYRHVVLYGKNKQDKHTMGVHRAVALAFIPTNDTSLTVNHIDQNPDNNSVENLEWMTNEENIKYSQGRKIRCIETGKKYSSINEAQRDTGVCCRTIRCSLKKEYQRTKRSKYTWEYV